MSLLKDLVPKREDQAISFIEYCRKHLTLDDGRPYDPIGRGFMKEIVDNYHTHPHMTVEKGAQTGFSTLAIAHTLYMVDVLGKNIIYYLPTDAMANMFGPTRFDPYVQRSEYLSSRIRGTDQKSLKQIGTHFFYIRGLVSKTGAISIPADEIIFDEVALINPENMELAQDRISAPGSLGWQKYFSVALFESDGIDELFDASDKRQWIVTCYGCRREATLESDFPDNIVKKNGDVFLVCPKCGHKLDVTNARWVAEHPDRDSRLGYRVPQLIIPDTKLSLIYERWEKAKDRPSKRATFRRSVLALPDSGNMQPISPAVLQRLEELSDYYFHDHSDVVTGVGIDMGDKAHVAIAQPYGSEGMLPIAFFEVEVEELSELVKHIEEAFNPGALVIDAMPYKTESKKIVRQLTKCRGYIQYFKGTELKEGEEGEGEKAVNKVTVDRDESLDETTDLFAANPPLALLPKPRNPKEEVTINTVKLHLKKLVKETSGSGEDATIHYKKNVANHFGMAINSARIALQLALGQSRMTGPAEYTPVVRSRFRKKGAY
ncbi:MULTISPECIES: phage terminase large subunit family protein [Brevibacillus]|uniref:phage terminase large subunit family protein n=1 Tax=Brevibacillus TaxID=55080 RepID=UPI000D1048B9|nr:MULTISPECIES: phage terminase large subunit family protein [Brevibacillus]PSJ66956.1 hypothetical protein C7J99_23015 [Brevibacillus brevis]RED27765.1 phage terminase large subunit GpA [Brevibacillus brevis]TQK42131.1 phage terminase large subunit GpA [Brevibacillus sp. AG162]VEF86802.1 Bacteriophage tail assembly protein [Brevibacillus brevis]GEC88605.1 hypothetical protein BBR01nite_09360 [Brevibacillus brevis]